MPFTLYKHILLQKNKIQKSLVQSDGKCELNFIFFYKKNIYFPFNDCFFVIF
jgi:hypothetical protein